jgi:TPR repeat protein
MVGEEGNLGVMYANGDGVPQDFAEAAKWFRKAADQGDTEAQSNLKLLTRPPATDAASLMVRSAAIRRALR